MSFPLKGVALACVFLLPVFCSAETDDTLSDSTRLLLGRIDVTRPGLEKVREAAATPAAAAQALLAYYRTRASVRHPVPRASAGARGSSATPEDIKRADNALNHILIGQKSYPPHFRGEDIDWATNPVPDKEWIWQLHRMYFWDSMAKAYLHTGDEKYASGWCMQLQDWVRKNPLDKQHHYAWRSIEAGIRGHSWTSLFQRFIDSPSFTPAVLVTFLNSCHDHAGYLMTKYSRKSNWGLMEAEGMAFIAMTFPEFRESEEWLREAVTRLNIEISNQVYPDGHQRELALGYHKGCIEWFMRTLDLAEMNGRRTMFPDAYLDTIETMCAVVMQVSFPDGSTPQFGDSWSGGPGSTYSSLKKWSALFDRPDMLYVATEGQMGVIPEPTAFALKESGFYSLRSGWNKNDIGMILKCGPDGGFHCQPDNGTFEICAGGRHLMPDSGCYIYSGDPANRNWFRSTRNHQTLTLNEKNSAFAPRLVLWQPGADLDILSVENRSYKNLTHRRTLCFIDKQFFVLIDDAVGTDTGEIDLNFQLAPGPAVFDTETLSARTCFPNGWNMAIRAIAKEGLVMEETEGRVSFKYLKQQPRPALRYRRNKPDEKPLRFVTLLVPHPGTEHSVSVTLNDRSLAATSEIVLQGTRNGTSRTITCSLPPPE